MLYKGKNGTPYYSYHKSTTCAMRLYERLTKSIIILPYYTYATSLLYQSFLVKIIKNYLVMICLNASKKTSWKNSV
jgi:hypothetical protein